MKSLKVLIVLATLSFAIPSFAKENMSAEAQAVDTACVEDAKTAQCPEGEKVGTGLLKCMHAYKKAHKDFKFSETCKTAMETHHAAKKAGTEVK